MALNQGYYEQAGLHVDILERDPQKNNIQQIVDGNAEYGVADSAVLLYRAQGKPLKLLASIFQHNPLVFIAKKDSGIVSPMEMKGKTISFQQGIDDSALIAMLEEAKLKPTDYRHVPADFTGAQFINGEVDVEPAYLSNEPFQMKELGIEINVINPLNYGIDFYGDNLITTEREVNEHPERVRAFLEASIRGWKYALAHKTETIAVLRAKYGAKSSEQHMIYEADVIEKMIRPDIVDIGYTSIDRIYRIADFYESVGKISKSQAKAARLELIYTPNDNKNRYRQYLAVAIAVLMVAILAAVRMGLSGRTLKLAAQKNSQAAMEALNLLEKIASRVPGMVYQFRMRQNGSSCFPFASDGIQDIYHVTAEEVRKDAAKVFDVIHPDDLDGVAASIQKSARDLTLWQHEYRVKYGDGTVRWLLGNAAPEREANGSTLWHGFITDITERIKIEQMKSEFISTVSHELRTPLTSISGSLGLVMGGVLGEIPEQASRIIDVAHRNSQRLTYLINDLLDMEKLEAGKMRFDMQRQNLLPLIELSIESNSAYCAARNVRLVLNSGISNLEVEVDSQRLLQVMSNLLSNAIKYSAENSTVNISVGTMGKSVRVSVTDSGPGIPKEFLNRIFQKFSQADSSDTRLKGGTGLGLAISKVLVERMQGQIGFTSIEGQGSCFYFDLPVSQT